MVCFISRLICFERETDIRINIDLVWFIPEHVSLDWILEFICHWFVVN